MGELDTQDAAQLIRTLSVIFLNLVPADAESLSITTELFLFVQIIYVCFRFNLERLFLKPALTHDHKGTMPHTHVGYDHDEGGTKHLSTEEKAMVDFVRKTWQDKNNK